MNQQENELKSSTFTSLNCQGGLSEFPINPFRVKEGLIETCAAMAAALFAPSSRAPACAGQIEMSRTPTRNQPAPTSAADCRLGHEFSASDVDIFPYRVKAMGLGKLIATHWGEWSHS